MKEGSWKIKINRTIKFLKMIGNPKRPTKFSNHLKKIPRIDRNVTKKKNTHRFKKPEFNKCF